MQNSIEPGDVEPALQTGAAIGDDRLQQQMRGTVVPDSFTHGTSAQRQRWFSNGFNSGQLSACDTSRPTALRNVISYTLAHTRRAGETAAGPPLSRVRP